MSFSYRLTSLKNTFFRKTKSPKKPRNKSNKDEGRAERSDGTSQEDGKLSNVRGDLNFWKSILKSTGDKTSNDAQQFHGVAQQRIKQLSVEITKAKPLDEQFLLDIEREAFLALCGEEKTQDRIRHFLKKGKPLRN